MWSTYVCAGLLLPLSPPSTLPSNPAPAPYALAPLPNHSPLTTGGYPQIPWPPHSGSKGAVRGQGADETQLSSSLYDIARSMFMILSRSLLMGPRLVIVRMLGGTG